MDAVLPPSQMVFLALWEEMQRKKFWAPCALGQNESKSEAFGHSS